ncbi:MAG: nitronate monooxygenase, partial [Candidatus Bathyarchaeia archaeon]
MAMAIRKVKELTKAHLEAHVRVSLASRAGLIVLDAIIEEREKDDDLARQMNFVITSAGDPTPHVEKLKKAGLIHAHVCASVYHARKAESAGVDVIIASGHEGGGHVGRDPVHSMVLLPAVVDSVSRPVVASGGFCDGRTLVCALALGAKGVQMGTRFIATEESEFHKNYKEAILRAEDRDSVVTLGYLGDIRFLKNPYIIERKRRVDERWPVEELREDYARKRGLAAGDGDVINGPVIAGEVAGRIKSIEKVERLIEGIVSEAMETIRVMHEVYIRSNRE